MIEKKNIDCKNRIRKKTKNNAKLINQKSIKNVAKKFPENRNRESFQQRGFQNNHAHKINQKRFTKQIRMNSNNYVICNVANPHFF